MVGTHKNVFVERARVYNDCHDSLNGQHKLTIHTYLPMYGQKISEVIKTNNKRLSRTD